MRQTKRSLMLLTLGAAALCVGCGADSTTYVAPGVRVEAESSGDGDRRVEIKTAAGTTTAETRGDRLTIDGPAGRTTLDAANDLADLGVPVPEGVRAKTPGKPMARITTPAAAQSIATLVTTLGPNEVVAFYDDHVTVTSKAVVADSAAITGTLEDGAHVNIRLAPPRDGERELVVFVTRPTR